MAATGRCRHQRGHAADSGSFRRYRIRPSDFNKADFGRSSITQLYHPYRLYNTPGSNYLYFY